MNPTLLLWDVHSFGSENTWDWGTFWGVMIVVIIPVFIVAVNWFDKRLRIGKHGRGPRP